MHQVERFEKRVNVHAVSAHGHGCLEVFANQFTSQYAVSLKGHAHRKGGWSSTTVGISNHHLGVLNMTLLHREQTSSGFQKG